VTATRDLSRSRTREARFTFRFDEAAATLGISRAPDPELVRTERVGSETTGRGGLVIRQHLDAFPGDGA
jgi:hypothetical protein